MHPEDFLTPEEFKQLLAHARTPRETALLRLLGGVGLRVSEVASLRAEHVAPKDGYIYISQGKGKKDRTTVAPKSVFAALAALNIDHGFLFPGYQGGHISTWEIGHILDKIAIAAGLQQTRPPAIGKQRDRKRITAHLLRHSYASWVLDKGLPVSDLQGQLGHVSLATTGIYLQRKPNHRRESFKAIDDDFK
jgi:integrase/recombinase XerD